MNEQEWKAIQQQIDMAQRAIGPYVRYIQQNPFLQRLITDQAMYEQLSLPYLTDATRVMIDLAQHHETLTSSLRLYTQVMPALSSYIQQVSPLWEQALRRLRSEQVQEAFAEYGLIPSPSMSTELIDEVIAAYGKGLDADTVAAIVLQFYDADDCLALTGVVSDLSASSEFAGWEGVLADTLAAHRAGLDRITTQALVPVIESITIPVLENWERQAGQLKPKERFTHNRIPTTLDKYIGDLPSRTVYAVGVEMIKCTIAYMQNYVYLQCWPETDEAIRTSTAHVQRHSLAHGWSKSGTRLNTIRCFLILDCMRVLLPVLRAAYEADQADGASNSSGYNGSAG